MKKFILISFITLTSIVANANGIVFKSGDASMLKKSDITVTVCFDYSNTEIEGKPAMTYLKEHGENFVKDWPKDNNELQKVFVQRWNKENKKGLQLTDDEKTEYRMVVTVTKLDMGSFGASFVVGMGAGGAKMSGKIELFKKGNNEPSFVLDVDGQTGKSEWTEQQRRISLYKELADDAVDCLKDAIK